MLPQKLTESTVANALPKERDYKLFDGLGLFLLVTTKGGRYWRMKYRFEGKCNSLSLGVYPDISLQAAREAHQKMRHMLAQGTDPAAERQREKRTSREEAARLRAQQRAANQKNRIKVTAYPEGGLEIWNGRQVLHLSPEEAVSVTRLLTQFLSGGEAHEREAH